MLLFLLLTFVQVAKAQQSLWNVPCSDITDRSEIYLQEQLSLSGTDVTSNFTTVYGLGNNFELGLNVLRVSVFNSPLRWEVNATDDSMLYGPLVMLNMQKLFQLSNDFHLGVGTQTGTNVVFQPGGVYRLANWTYADLVYKHPGSAKKIIFGLYYANAPYRAPEGVGYMIGVEWPIIEKKFHIIIDYISGYTPISAAVFGAGYYIGAEDVLSAGYQPAINGNESAAVFELTIGAD